LARDKGCALAGVFDLPVSSFRRLIAYVTGARDDGGDLANLSAESHHAIGSIRFLFSRSFAQDSTLTFGSGRTICDQLARD
jgi:hypothetical protein